MHNKLKSCLKAVCFEEVEEPCISVISFKKMFVRFAATVILVSTVLVPSAALADATVTAIGSIFCRNGMTPLRGVRVELMDSDCDGSEICDDVMGTGVVAPDGSFNVTGRGGDPFGGDPDVYVRFAYNDDQGVRMTDEADVTRSASTPQHDHNNTRDGSTIDFGRITVAATANDDESPRCAIFTAVRRAYRDYVDNINPAHQAPPAGHIDILMWSAIWAGTAWTNTDTVHWPIDYPSRWAAHEFGHSIRHAADGSGQHFAGDVVAYRYARNHDNTCANDANAQPGELLTSVRAFNFNEGWADYWENKFPDCAGILTDMGEASVAKYLLAYQSANGLTKMDMVNVLVGNPGSVHNIDEFAEKLSAQIGVSRDALTSRAETWRRAQAQVPMPIPKDDHAYTLAQKLALTRTAIDAVQSEIASRRRAAAQALAIGREARPRTCRDADCEAVFNAIVRPIMLQGEGDALETYAVKLREARSPRWVAQVQRAHAEGRFDEWFGLFRRGLQNSARVAMMRALTRADAALARARPRMSSAYDVYARELAKGRARLAPGSVERGSPTRSFSFWAPQFELPQDRLRVALR